MAIETEKNIYGLSEGVFKACQFLGLKFPPEALDKPQPLPSDYFGDDFELDSIMKAKLRSERNWTAEMFDKNYKTFAKKFYSQKPLKHTKTDLNIYFCDNVLFSGKDQGASSGDYFAFEFYRKSFAERRTFITNGERKQIFVISNEFRAPLDTANKINTNHFFADFLHRDWLDAFTCTFEEFQSFINKHPRFVSKPPDGSLGKGVEIINVGKDESSEKIFANLKNEGNILEEIVVQHEEIAAFCPDTVNTIRVYSFLDIHNIVHILATTGRFGRVGQFVDNFLGGGFSAIIDPKTGIIISDGINEVHERVQKHPDTGKTFKGFQYPCWKKLRATIAKMAKMTPQLHHIGWDIAINNKEEIVLIEANRRPGVESMQSADSVGRLHLYKPLLKELQNYKRENMLLLGYKVNNNLKNFETSYQTPIRNDSRLRLAMSKLIPDCKSLLDLGCRNPKFVKSLCPAGVKYFPVDYKNFDDEVIICNFNKGEFPDIKADVCFCALTAEYVETLPQFLADMCNAAQKQILMWCRPADKENSIRWRRKNPFLTDFTEEFLIKSMEKNNFQLTAQYPSPSNAAVILYDFRRI